MTRLVVATTFWSVLAVSAICFIGTALTMTLPWGEAVAGTALFALMLVPIIAPPVFRVWDDERARVRRARHRARLRHPSVRGGTSC